MSQTMPEVLSALDGIIANCRDRNSAAGYFPARYPMVTQRVLDGIRYGEFEDGPRMERLDGVFADRDLAHIWPAFGWFDRVVGTVDGSVANFSMKVARREAWTVAETLAPLEGAALAAAIPHRDGEAAAFGRFLSKPGWAAGLALAVVRVSERGGVRYRIDQLAR